MVSISLPVLGGLLPGTSGDDQYIGTRLGIQSAIIRTEEGNDTIIGINRDPGILSAGIGDSFINAGDGDDLVMAIAFPDPEGKTNFAISGGAIELGAGNDTLIASGIAGVNNVVIDGGAGDDLLDVQSGNGTVSGGEGFDTLALDGSFSEFSFLEFEISSDNSGIVVGSIDTSLVTFGFEIFQFDDMSVLTSELELEML